VHSINASQELNPIETAQERLIAAGWAQERFIASLFSVLAILALLLSMMGLYSVITYTVSQRSKEFGLRIALGASRGRILQQVMLSSSFLIGIGLLVGIFSGLSLQHVVLRWTQADIASPLVLVPVAMILIAVGLLASLIPALRAASIDPMQALRTE
jgi:ABC-type antimicrobial peptide transport system permease subunit